MGAIPMYNPNKNENAIMVALQDLGYQVWWTGYDIVTSAPNDTKTVLGFLIKKGWIKGSK